MAIEQISDGRWRVDVEPIKGKRFRKTVKTKAEALRFEATCRASCINTPDWSPKPKDVRRLSALISLWFDLHGHSLRDGIRRRDNLTALSLRLGNPVALKLDPQLYASDRRKRLDSGLSAKTLNNQLCYIRAVFNELRSLAQIDYPNPLEQIKPLPVFERELSWLTPEQVDELLLTVRTRCDNPHVHPVVLICLATGARWSEAQNTKQSSVRSGFVTFSGTKSGKVRSVPVSPSLHAFLLDHWQRHGQFTDCISSFRTALAKTTIKLPRGQASHALRHTFASQFIQNGGNILTLQKILGHSSLVMTMRYAHLAPDHLTDVLRFGPLANFDTFSTDTKKTA